MSPVKSKTDQAYEDLKESLRMGLFRPGERLTEGKVIKKLGLSRGPVRELLARLEGEGLVQGRGAYRSKQVACFLEDQSHEEALFRYEMREAIEGMAARVAAKNMNGWDIERLRKHIDQMVQCLEDNDREGANRSVIAFHNYLVAHCGNPLLVQAWQAYHLAPTPPRSAELQRRIMSVHTKDRDWETVCGALLDAIAAHDPDRAEHCVREDMRRTTDVIRNAVWEGPEGGQAGLSRSRAAGKPLNKEKPMGREE